MSMRLRDVKDLVKTMLPVELHEIVERAHGIPDLKTVIEMYKVTYRKEQAQTFAQVVAPPPAHAYIPTVAPALISNMITQLPETFNGEVVAVKLRTDPRVNMIGCIKTIREMTCLSLKDAKDICDRVRDGRRQTLMETVGRSKLWEMRHTLQTLEDNGMVLDIVAYPAAHPIAARKGSTP